MDFNLATVIGPALTDTSANSNARSWRDFVSLINGSWRKGAGDFIACGRHLIAAKDELARDAFNAMVKKLDFASSVARRLECIASNETLCSHVNSLPPCWSTLYYLSQLPEDVLEAALADGRINPGMMRKDAIALKSPKKIAAESTTANPASVASNPTELGLAWWNTIPKDQRRTFLDQLGRAGLCADMSVALLADFRDHLIGLAIAGASDSSPFAIYATGKLRSALYCAEQPEPDANRMAALLNCIIKNANAKGIARGDVVIAQGKLKGRK